MTTLDDIISYLSIIVLLLAGLVFFAGLVAGASVVLGVGIVITLVAAGVQKVRGWFR